mmetsp:Transcript_31752/g.54162  ORF Transcript_31752/g.54162 Transcript_31752/m.54162 type:complete len:113 (+) Transcript_31752:277-615(+)
MSTEHWQSFQKQQSFKHADSTMPIDSVVLERQRRKQAAGMSSAKSLFCCLSVLVGRPSVSARRNSKKAHRSQQMGFMSNFGNDDDSFGYNFDDEQMSPRVSRRLANDGHNFN